MIVKEPLPLLIPVNESGMFSCKALCVGFQCTGYWIINSRQHNVVNEQGMISHFSNSQTHDEYTLTLTVNASESMNNTSIRCRYEALFGTNHIIDSATVYLFVMSSKTNYYSIIATSTDSTTTFRFHNVCGFVFRMHIN